MTIQPSCWWIDHPEWLDDEMEALRHEGLHPVLEEDTERAVLSCSDPRDGNSRRLEIVYPDSFPDMPPHIYGDQYKDLGRHVNPNDGMLCLIGRDPVSWKPSLTAARLIVEQLPELVDSIMEGGERLRRSEEPQGEPFSAFYEYAQNGAVLIPEEFLATQISGTRGTFSVSANNSAWMKSALTRQDPMEFGQCLLRSLTSRGTRLDTALDLRGFQNVPIRGHWAAVETPPSGSTANEVLNSLREVFSELKHPRKITKPTLFGVIFDEEVHHGVWSPAWLFLAVQWVKDKKGQEGTLHNALLRGLRYTRQDLMARIPELHTLPAKTVAILGQGALGSDLDFELARSQIGTLRLADYDFADPAASVRGADGIPAAGIHKAGYQAAKLKSHFPLLNVEPVDLYIGQAPRESPHPGQHERQILARLLSAVDLVVDATADENVNLALSRAVESAEIPHVVVWGVDGYGGVIVRLRPGVTGCFFCFLIRRAPEYDGDDRIVPPPAAENNTSTQPRGCTEITVAATGFDLSVLANHAARVAAATLSEGESNGYPPYQEDVWVLAIRNPNGSLRPAPQWQSYKLPPHPDCPRCGSIAN